MDPTLTVNGEVSFWHAALGGAGATRPALPGPTDADVCVVGAGYTGLWTAWYLSRLDPGLRIVVLEAAHVGFGASGRNGGWLSGILPGSRDRLAKGAGGRDGVLALQRQLRAAVGDVVAWTREQGVDADVAVGGSLAVATTGAGLGRLRAELAEERDWGASPDDIEELSPDAVNDRVRVAGAQGGLFSRHCARIQPAKLVRGLADAVERHGVVLHENTPVEVVGPGLARTPLGDVRARWVVRATEGFTAGLPGHRRDLLPMNSSMIVTEPLDAPVWDAIGWQGAETVRDAAHAYVYAQRTADDRIAIGGRGVPYRFGSRTDRGGATHEATIAALTTALHRLWPATAGAAIAHGWCGVLGVARDWCPTVAADPSTGLAWAGGYVGDGVTTAHLAGRTLAELLTGTDSERTRLPWIGRSPRRWEPEPFRWAGVRAVYSLYRRADRSEAAAPQRAASSPLAVLADRISGRP
ncbi:FAD-binding oxidoreductase [Acidiferrimicrobium sp. IK]|uniref:NAD(P)/FAD-dependent oxidoreductase n=1 Tax=Acidiferrimicrobium sp. IK TaxID=2871700 RepID=UPI0021CB2770|nr:FAD-binding oxidoreductase [Acidiferrimicrobium sp. IK]MCU4183558.1 FAD-binding oxidoreductase [Acidiferrimicrobium sp. IK]